MLTNPTLRSALVLAALAIAGPALADPREFSSSRWSARATTSRSA